MNILLHICCAPCALYTVDRLKQEGHRVEGFFYNPNIAPLAEYKLRRAAVAAMAKRMNLKVTYQDEARRPFRAAASLGLFISSPRAGAGEEKPALRSSAALMADKPQRCVNCWFMRLEQASRAAKQAEFDAFSTSLLISPYQDHEMLKSLGYALAKEGAVDFYYEDFRAGFRKSQQMAKELRLYRQKYCGCEFSMTENREPKTENERIR